MFDEFGEELVCWLGFMCGCQTVGVDASRLEQSGGEGTIIVSMSGSDDGSGSLVAVLWMLTFVGVWIGASCMVMGGEFFWESSPFPIGAEASPSLYRLTEGE